MTNESVVVQNLRAMRKNLIASKESAILCGFSYEVVDAINELIYFTEFDLDELEEGYE